MLRGEKLGSTGIAEMDIGKGRAFYGRKQFHAVVFAAKIEIQPYSFAEMLNHTHPKKTKLFAHTPNYHPPLPPPPTTPS